MKTSDFDYNLPEELIAQKPLDKRDESRLLVVDRKTGKIEDKHFYDILNYLKKGDTLVLNDSRVFHARLFGVKKETGAKIEVFVLKNLADNDFEVMIKPAKRVKVGTVIEFDEDFSCEVAEKFEEGLAHVRFYSGKDVCEKIEETGKVPLPPYIHEKLEDKERYQTVFNNETGSAAAPTAGLHFTKELLKEIKNRGVNITYITLHVGLGTFRPVKEDDITGHKMHSERFIISKESADIINTAKKNGGSIFAVGTTSVRTLESCMRKYGEIIPVSMDTDIFIYPGYKFRIVDHLITNFHLPKSTLLMLISAFYDRDNILSVYKYSVEEKYRFFSFGDAMLIL